MLKKCRRRDSDKIAETAIELALLVCKEVGHDALLPNRDTVVDFNTKFPEGRAGWELA